MSGGGPGAPELSQAEKKLLQFQTQAAREQYGIQMELLPHQLESMRLQRDPQTGEITEIPYDEWMAKLDPDERLAAQAQTEAGQMTLRALRGELTNPAVEKQLASQKADMHEQLINSGVTPGSAAYTRAMGDLQSQQTFTRRGINLQDLAAAQGITLGTPLAGGQQGMMSGFGGGAPDLSGPLSTLGGIRGQKQQYAWNQYQNQQQATAGGAATGAYMGSGFGPWGTVIGGIVGAGAGYASTQ